MYSYVATYLDREISTNFKPFSKHLLVSMIRLSAILRFVRPYLEFMPSTTPSTTGTDCVTLPRTPHKPPLCGVKIKYRGKIDLKNWETDGASPPVTLHHYSIHSSFFSLPFPLKPSCPSSRRIRGAEVHYPWNATEPKPEQSQRRPANSVGPARYVEPWPPCSLH